MILYAFLREILFYETYHLIFNSYFAKLNFKCYHRNNIYHLFNAYGQIIRY
ncbi:MAG: hypothetical protein ACD_2C00248G0007 [uncultured bacterium (gcode 4)]|uniref:Uncharacterized protein n=1 Tax=uncultured bacterium (gcode 4) TaxID=1234023 RepID=K2GFD4_9BACT|nr:MAG: hypothetical protein ACD_2C00248G0007 [uncultured bacterium (gcode 4)]